jgi:choline kinase
MKVAMLAAGVGRRLGRGEDAPPKALLRFNGQTLLQRHLEILAHFGLFDVTLAVGHQAALIERELAALGARDRVRTCYNPDYERGSLLSAWTLREVLRAGAPVLYMDADVLYDWRLLGRLLDSPHADCILIGRGAPDPEWLEVRLRDGRIVAFGRGVTIQPYDLRAEWVGFAKLSAESSERLARALQRYVHDGRGDVMFENALRDVILEAPDAFGFEDITGLPWIEIDFPDDVLRARTEILPRLVNLPQAPR